MVLEVKFEQLARCFAYHAVYNKITKGNMILSNDITINMFFNACVLKICSKNYFFKARPCSFTLHSLVARQPVGGRDLRTL